MKPELGSLVLGGTGPRPGSAVLGGLDGVAGKLGFYFERFNREAKPCNGDYLRLELSDRVALVRKRRSGPYDDIKIKYFVFKVLPTTFQDRPVTLKYWEFAGWLKHSGILFGCKATYEHGNCVKDTRRLVVAELLGHHL